MMGGVVVVVVAAGRLLHYYDVESLFFWLSAMGYSGLGTVEYLAVDFVVVSSFS